MGVIYKLTDEVVNFIISQRQNNPNASCRELAESASSKFGLQLSKSSVHDVLKDSGIITPRGRKPSNKFQIPQEKKKTKFKSAFPRLNLPDLLQEPKALPVMPSETKPVLPIGADLKASQIRPPVVLKMTPNEERVAEVPAKESREDSPEYEGAGRVFLKAAFWDLGVFSEGDIKEAGLGLLFDL